MRAMSTATTHTDADTPHATGATPARPVIVFDGDCPFCRQQIAKIRRMDRHDVFEYVPRQAEGLEQRFPKLAEGDFNTGMRLVHVDGTIDIGADAVYGIARRVGWWRWFAWLYRVPVLKQICRAGYAWIARNRQRLGKTCDNGACKID
ncbi:MAG: DUF393 domain-containing protein [Phycisphaera sp.]|nr:DUF393 domain-containing protein [Phycisphaera sp.]